MFCKKKGIIGINLIVTNKRNSFFIADKNLFNFISLELLPINVLFWQNRKRRKEAKVVKIIIVNDIL